MIIFNKLKMVFLFKNVYFTEYLYLYFIINDKIYIPWIFRGHLTENYGKEI